MARSHSTKHLQPNSNALDQTTKETVEQMKTRKITLAVVLGAILFASLSLDGYALASQRKANESVLSLSDLPENWSGPTSNGAKSTKSQAQKCFDFGGLLKPASASLAGARYENNADTLIHVVAQFNNEIDAAKAFSRIGKWAKSCAKISNKVDGIKQKIEISPVNFDPNTTPTRIEPFRMVSDASGIRFDGRVIFYQQGTAVGVLAFAGFVTDIELLKTSLDTALRKA
jgi:hypothetical protein